jgi:hypothetical protein
MYEVLYHKNIGATSFFRFFEKAGQLLGGRIFSSGKNVWEGENPATRFGLE